MRLYQLVSELGNVVVHNEGTSHTMVLTPEGAVYSTEDTSDVRKISIAFGLLTTSDSWRLATQEEIQELRAHPPTPMMELSWIIPPPKPRPKLTIVREPAQVVYEKDGMKIYDDDDTQ